VRVAPCFGSLPSLSVRIPHPDGGWISAELSNAAGTLQGSITLPEGITGRLEWAGASIPLRAGVNAVAAAPRSAIGGR
jgi:hypothetical protein